MDVVMVGAGYVGLTTGACLASLGNSVTCVDIDSGRIEALRRGEVPIYEPGLAELIRENTAAGRLRFSTGIQSAVRGAAAVFLAVGTPAGRRGDIDLTFVDAAVRQTAPHLRPGAVVVVKSTVVAGTARRLQQLVADLRGKADVLVASNPEFLREGSAIDDFCKADRVVIGADDPTSARLLRDLYRPLETAGVPIVMTTTENAELIKYAANAFLALKIGFINDVADLCEAAGGDVAAIAEGIGLDHRIGRAFLSAGPGFGGSCFPKDTRAFAATGRRYGRPQPLIEALIERNEDRKRSLAQRVVAELRATAPGGRVAVLGTAFKANTDDVRESAALTIIPILQQAGLTVAAHDPKAAAATVRQQLTGVEWASGAYDAAAGADLVLILTEWDEYRRLDLKRLSTVMRGRTIFDYRNILSPDDAVSRGFRYVGLGRPAMSAANDQSVPATAAAPRRGIAASPA